MKHKLDGDHKITTFYQGHFTMVQIEMLDGTSRVGIGFAKYNPEDACRPVLDEGHRVYMVKTDIQKRRTGRVKKINMLVALKRKPFLYNPLIGYDVALARAIRDIVDKKTSLIMSDVPQAATFVAATKE